MAHAKALGIKWLFTTVILLSFLAIFESISFGQILLISFVLTVITYIAGDILLLPMYGMFVAAIGDFGISFVAVWMLAAAVIGQSTALVLATAAVAYFFVLCEGLFHVYMKEYVLPKKQAVIIPFPTMRYQTETSEELQPDKND